MKRIGMRPLALILSAVFFLLTVMCWMTLPLFGDDYGYALYFRNGWTGFAENMAEHYRTVNGRTLVHALDVLLLQGNGWPARVFLCVLSAAFLLLLTELGAGRISGPKKTERSVFLAAASGLVWFFGLPVLRESVFWITGAMNYLLSATLVLWLLYSARRYRESGRGIAGLILSSLLTAWSTETAAVAAILILGALWAERWLHAKKSCLLPLVFLTAVLVSLTLLWAPGNRIRMSYYPDFYAQNILERVAGHFSEWCWTVFSDRGLGAAGTMLLCLGAGHASEKERTFLKKARDYGLLLSLFLACGVQALGNWSAEKAILPSLPLFLGLCLLEVKWLRTREYRWAGMTALAMGLQFCMLLTPVFGPRTVFLSAALLLTECLEIIGRDGRETRGLSVLSVILCLYLPLSRPRRWLLALAVLILTILLWAFRKWAGKGRAMTAGLSLCFAVALLAGSLTAAGYVGNAGAYRRNEERLKAAAENKSQTVELERPANDWCRYLYFEDASDWHRAQMRTYYRLDPDTDFLWTEVQKQEE